MPVCQVSSQQRNLKCDLIMKIGDYLLKHNTVKRSYTIYQTEMFCSYE